MSCYASQGRAKPIDVPFQLTDCKYPGDESLPGGILHHKVHLGGGSKMQQEDWYKLSPEIKGSMSDWVKDLAASRTKKSKGIYNFCNCANLSFHLLFNTPMTVQGNSMFSMHMFN